MKNMELQEVGQEFDEIDDTTIDPKFMKLYSLMPIPLLTKVI